MRGRAAPAVRLALLAAALAGCEPSVRRALPGHVRTIAVAEFANATDQPLLPGELLEEVRRAVRLDGRLAVAGDPATADALLGGTVAELVREPARFDANNVIQEMRLRIVVEASLTDRAAGLPLWGDAAAPRRIERSVYHAVVPGEGLAAETEADALRRLLRDLADDLVRRALEGW